MLNQHQIKIIRIVANEFVQRKLNYLCGDEKFATRFNLKRMSEGIECELVNKRSHMFPIKSLTDIKEYEEVSERILREIVSELNV